jgi:hypothetical protein
MVVSETRLSMAALSALGCVWVSLLAAGCGSAEDSVSSANREAAARVSTSPGAGARSGNCDAMSSKLRWDYESVQTCARNEDCNYVDGFYAIVPREATDRKVTTVACGIRSPFLIVANGRLLQQSMDNILKDLQLQAGACASPDAPRPENDTCSAQAGFTSSTPPVCLEGVCKSVRGSGYYGPP